MELNCTITTPEKLVHDGAAKLVVVPAHDGEIGILHNHAPLMALLGVGEMRISTGGGDTESFFVRGGFVQVIEDHVTVLATEAERCRDIDKEAAAAEARKLRESPHSGLSATARQERNDRLHAAEIRARLAGAH